MRRSAETAAAFSAVALQGLVIGLWSRLPWSGQAVLEGSFLLVAGGMALALRATAPEGAIHRHLSTTCFGALGMLMGWFADAGFRPLVGRAPPCRSCSGFLAGSDGHWSWMPTCMLAGCLVGHWFVGSDLWPSGRATLRLGACTCGMLAGMALAGSAAGALRLTGPITSLIAAHGAMTAGMAAGSLAADAMASRALRLFPPSFPTGAESAPP